MIVSIFWLFSVFFFLNTEKRMIFEFQCLIWNEHENSVYESIYFSVKTVILEFYINDFDVWLMFGEILTSDRTQHSGEPSNYAEILTKRS